VSDIKLEVLRPASEPHSRSTEVPTDFIAVKRRQDRAIEIEEYDCVRRSDHNTSFGQVSQVDIVSAYRLTNRMPSGRRIRIVATSAEEKSQDQRARNARTHGLMMRRRVTPRPTIH
jgi:hypothetical protein